MLSLLKDYPKLKLFFITSFLMLILCFFYTNDKVFASKRIVFLANFQKLLINEKNLSSLLKLNRDSVKMYSIIKNKSEKHLKKIGKNSEIYHQQIDKNPEKNRNNIKNNFKKDMKKIHNNSEIYLEHTENNTKMDLKHIKNNSVKDLKYIEKRFEKRLEHLKRSCTSINFTSDNTMNSVLYRFIYSKKNGLLSCLVAKVELPFCIIFNHKFKFNILNITVKIFIYFLNNFINFTENYFFF